MLLSKNSTRVLSLAKHATNAASQVKKTKKACLPFNPSQIRTMKFQNFSVEDFDSAPERRGMNDDGGKILTPEGVAEINNKFLPSELIPQPVVYNGKQQYRTAYVLMRMPRMSPEEHPLDVEFFNLQRENYMQTKDHNYEYFTEYYEAWKKHKKPSEDSKKKGASNVEVRTSASGKILVSEAKSKAKAAITRLPNAAPWTDQQKIDFARNLGQGMPTPLTENWLKNWKPASRYTDADFNDNRKSLYRKLNQRLYFVVKSRKTGKWKFPDMVRFNPLTLRLSAELLFKYQMKKSVYGHFLSNSPIAHYKNPANSLESVHFFSAIYVHGVPPFKELKKYYSDHAWVSRQELLELDMVDDSYKRVAYDMLWDSGFDCMLDPEEYRGLLSSQNQVSAGQMCEQYFEQLKVEDRLPSGMLTADVIDDGKHEPE